jgi:N-acetylmuramoyl-L-alanine amidase
VPSALIELGYLSSRSDVQQLSDPEWRRRAAESVARAVTTFLDASQARLPEAPPAASAERAAR